VFGAFGLAGRFEAYFEADYSRRRGAIGATRVAGEPIGRPHATGPTVWRYGRAGPEGRELAGLLGIEEAVRPKSAAHTSQEAFMLGNRNATPTVAVKDTEVARKFYEGMLGLKLIEGQQPEVLLYNTGNSRLLVYKSQYAGTNKATAITWFVGDDVDGVVQSLKAKGVGFEKYDFPNSTREGDVHVMGGVRAAWFKDPDGNIHSLVNR